MTQLQARERRQQLYRAKCSGTDIAEVSDPNFPEVEVRRLSGDRELQSRSQKIFREKTWRRRGLCEDEALHRAKVRETTVLVTSIKLFYSIERI